MPETSFNVSETRIAIFLRILMKWQTGPIKLTISISRMNRNFLLFTCLLANWGIIYASETPADTVRLREVVVTAPYKTEPDLIPLNVTRVTSSEIEQSSESSLLPVLVNKVAGLFVAERGVGDYGILSDGGIVNIRGVGQTNKVLFMIDGQPQWAGMYGHALPDTYVANGVERVEVIKGPSSLLYGSNAMGGSINIITQSQSREGVSGRARAMFGSYSTQKFALSSGYKKNRFSAMLSGQLDRSNGYRKGSAYWLANEFAQLKYSVSDHWSVAGMLELTQTIANYPGTTQTPLENMWTDISRGTGSVFIKNRYEKVDGGVQAYINWGRHNVDDGNAPGTDPRDYLFHSTDYNMGVTLYESLYLWKDNIISAGIDFQHWGGHIWNTSKANESERSAEQRHHVNEIAGYAMMQQGFFNDILDINAGVRLQHGSPYGNVWVPQAGFIVKPGHTAQIKALFSKGFRSPNIRELYLYPPASNPDLKPEYMLNYEISYRQQFLDNRLMAGAAIYYIDGKDMIERTMIEGRPKLINTGRFHNKGFELEASYIFLPNLRAYASWAYLHTDSNILYAPKNKLNLEINYSPGNFSFTLEEMSIWSMNNGNPDGPVNYSLLNLRAAYTLPGKVPVTLSLKLDNLTDNHYEVIYGCPLPGTTVLGGVEIKF